MKKNIVASLLLACVLAGVGSAAPKTPSHPEANTKAKAAKKAATCCGAACCDGGTCCARKPARRR